MPYLEPAQNDGVGQSYLRITLRGLQYPASQYNRIEIFCVGRGSYLVGTGGGSSSGEYWTDPRTFSGLSAGSSYSFYAEAQYASGGRVVRIPDSGYYNFWTLDPPTPSTPSQPSISGSVSGRSITLTVNKGSNTTYIEFEDHEGYASYLYDSSNTVRLTVPNFDTQYVVYARGHNNVGTSGWTRYSFWSGSDNQAPTVRITTINGDNGIYVAWTASDNGTLQGTYYVYLGSAGGNFNSLSLMARTSGSSYTMALDRYGGAFENGKVYPVRIGVYDSADNYGYDDRYVTVTKAKPSSFAWDTAKVSGRDVQVTATEWNSLYNKINEFRSYKGLAPYNNFNYASRGWDVLATQFNQAVNAINTMSPSTPAPPTVISKQDLLASYLNRLRDSLNSIA